VECACIFKEASQPVKISVFLVNFSKGGIYMLFTGHKVIPGTIVEFVFKIPNEEAPLCVSGRVLRTKIAGPVSHYESGIEFENVKQEKIDRLTAYLSKKALPDKESE